MAGRAKVFAGINFFVKNVVGLFAADRTACHVCPIAQGLKIFPSIEMIRIFFIFQCWGPWLQKREKKKALHHLFTTTICSCISISGCSKTKVEPNRDGIDLNLLGR